VRLSETVDGRLFRIAAAQHHAVLARYWLVAERQAEARRDATRALRYTITPDGVAALALAVLPVAACRILRQARRATSRALERQ
jgi:hypothetical protein